MDIVALQQQLKAAGFPISTSQIEALIKSLDRAIVDGRIKKSTLPDSNRYPLKQTFEFLQGKDKETNYPALWQKAVNRYPGIETFRTVGSYSNNLTQAKKAAGIASLTLPGVISLAAVLGYTPSAVINQEASSIESVVPVRNGYIYVLADTARNVLKVGVTGDLDARLKQHKSSNPYLVPIVFFPVELRESEFRLHQVLEEYRVPGLKEWYRDCVEVRQLISAHFWLS